MANCRIAILPCGSHGDHQPFVPFMQALSKIHGCQVQMWVGCDEYVETFGAFGVDVKCIAEGMPSVDEVLKTNEEVREAMATGNGFAFLKAMGGLQKEFGPKIRDGVLEACAQYKPHLLVYSPLYLGLARLVFDKHNIPVCMSYFYPRCPSKEYFPLNFAMPTVNLPFGLNESAHWLVNKMANAASLDSDAQEFRKNAGLPAVTMQDLWDLYTCEDLPQVGGWSPLVSPPCADWKNVNLTGWWTIPEDLQVQQFKPSEELNNFLGAGSKPIYIGWGSMLAGSAPEMARLAAEAAMAAGVRAIVLGGWAKIDPSSLPTEELKKYAQENMLFHAGKLPHEWLLPRCSCAVIHGGAGTTGVVLRSGIPCIVTPCLSDQFFWATRINTLEVGRGFSQHLLKVSSKDLAAAILECVSSQKIKQNALGLGKKLRLEKGAESAAAIFAKVAKESASGAWTNTIKDKKTVLCQIFSR